jgi:hypothetical protein
MSGEQIRIGDREREAAVSALGEHYAAGRIDKDEYDERSERAYAAKTAADLAPLFRDLPNGSRATAAPRPQREPRRHEFGWGFPVLPILVIVGFLVVVSHFWPLWIVFGVLWWTGVLRFGRRRFRRGWSDDHNSGSWRSDRGSWA